MPEKAAIVQRIYREALAGDGLQTITRRLNEEAVPMLGRGTSGEKSGNVRGSVTCSRPTWSLGRTRPARPRSSTAKFDTSRWHQGRGTIRL